MINVALANVRDPEWFHELWTNRYLTTGNSRDPIYTLRAVLPADNNIFYKGRSVSAPERLLRFCVPQAWLCEEEDTRPDESPICHFCQYSSRRPPFKLGIDE